MIRTVLGLAFWLALAEGFFLWRGGRRFAVRRTAQLVIVIGGLEVINWLLALRIHGFWMFFAGALVAVFDPAPRKMSPTDTTSEE